MDNIYLLEMLVASLALKHFFPVLAGRHVPLCTKSRAFAMAHSQHSNMVTSPVCITKGMFMYCECSIVLQTLYPGTGYIFTSM